MLQKYQSGSGRQAEELMDREAALKAIHENVKNENLIKHMLATEAIMRALARRFKENEDEWGLAGLLIIIIKIYLDNLPTSRYKVITNGWDEN